MVRPAYLAAPSKVGGAKGLGQGKLCLRHDMRKKGLKIHKRALRVGAYLTKDADRQPGGLIYTVCAARERNKQLGKMGAASDVRRIDPKTGEIVGIIPKR